MFRGENYDLRTKRMTKNWEETLVRKHELWEIYKSIKKNLSTAATNVKIVKNQLKQADNALLKLMKTHALNPKDLGITSRINEAKTRKKEIEEQLEGARGAKMQIEEQKKNSYAKAQMASIEAAKAKAAAEKAFRAMVVHNNKTCSLCSMGKEKIAKRRLEIQGTIKQEI